MPDWVVTPWPRPAPVTADWGVTMPAGHNNNRLGVCDGARAGPNRSRLRGEAVCKIANELCSYAVTSPHHPCLIVHHGQDLVDSVAIPFPRPERRLVSGLPLEERPVPSDNVLDVPWGAATAVIVAQQAVRHNLVQYVAG